MNRAEFEEITAPEYSTSHLVKADFFPDDMEGTLLFGYTCDREDWRVYLQGGKIHVLVYNDTRKEVIEHAIRPVRTAAIRVVFRAPRSFLYRHTGYALKLNP